MSGTYHFEWKLRAPPAALWPYVSDTQRLNQALGLPPWEFTDQPDEKGARREGSMHYLGLDIRWDEKPYEWNEGRELGVERLYRNGPLSRLRSRVKLAQDGAGTLLQHSLEFEPRAFFWTPIARFELGVKVRRGLDSVYRHLDDWFAKSAPTPFARRPRVLSAAARKRLAEVSLRLELADGVPREVVQRLGAALVELDDRALVRLRPLELADRWVRPRGEVLRAFLCATRRGLLVMTWDVLCPRCRGAKARVEQLASLATTAHCAWCGVTIDTAEERSLELVFAPSPTVASLDVPMQCVGGPGNTPHIVLQRRLAAGERAVVPLGLARGTYRLRSQGTTGVAHLSVGPFAGAASKVSLRLTATTIEPAERELAGLTELEVVNDDSRERLAILERAEWHDDAVTARVAFSNQDFLELFPRQAPPASLALRVGRLSVLCLLVEPEPPPGRLDPDERAVLRRDLRVAIASDARARGGALSIVPPPGAGPDELAYLVSFPEPGVAASAFSALAALVASFCAARELPFAAVRAGLVAGPCTATSVRARQLVSGDACVQATAIARLGRPGELVVDARLREESGFAEAVAFLPFVAEPLEGLTGAETRRLERLVPRQPPARQASVSAATQGDGFVTLDALDLGAELGRGGSAVVRAGRHKTDGRRFAVKFQPASTDRAAARFVREITALRKLVGVPGIVPIHGHGQRGDDLWLVLDLLEGRSLEELLATSGTLTVAKAAFVLAPVARALHAAHQRGIIHRDVKPSNVVLDAAGVPWLVDFGVAQIDGQRTDHNVSGTLSYLPPEAFDDVPVLDARSDVYALGATFYELLTGEAPFTGENRQELVVRIMSESAPELGDRVAVAGEHASAVIRCALHKAPDERYPTAATMAQDLERMAKGEAPLDTTDVDGPTGTQRFKSSLLRRALSALSGRWGAENA